jgi:tetratricopeptide (TPR) repeat protein
MMRSARHALATGSLVGLFGIAALAGCGGASRTPPPGDALDQIEAAQLFQYGNALATQGDSIRAEQYLAAAMERGYPEAEVMPRLLEVCIQASRLSAALGYAEPYLERHQEEWPLRLLIASIQMSLNQHGSARSNLERVLEMVPDEPEPHYLMGVLLRDRYADPEASNVEFVRYLELSPGGNHAGEARLSIAGRYLPPTEASPDPPPRPTPSETEPPSPAGPTRLPPHGEDDPAT